MEEIEVTPVIIYKKPFRLELLLRKQVDEDELRKHHVKKEYTAYWQKYPFRFLLECRQPLTTIKEIFSVFRLFD